MASGDHVDALAATQDTPGGGTATAPHPATIGRYRIEAPLGEGGMGVVLLAWDASLGRKVAIKVLHSEQTEAARERFSREAQVMARLVHENVIVVHDVGEHAGRRFVAMEYVAGGTLAAWQKGRDWRAIVAMYVRAGRGLEAAHRAGLVHRDFKPDNVLVGDDGRLRVTDFGLVTGSGADDDPLAHTTPATAIDARAAVSGDFTRTGTLLGTPRYMAPEQHARGDLDARADQFAYCVALYEALFGRAPFVGRTYLEIATSVTEGSALAPPADVDVPARVRAAIMRGLRRERDARFPSMTELLAVLEGALAPRRRRRWPLALAGAGAIVAAIAIAVVVIAGSRADAERERARAAKLESQLVALRPKPAALAPIAGRPQTFDELAIAREAYDRADRAYQEERYDDAHDGFLAAYASHPNAMFLYNAAAARHMQAKRMKDPTKYAEAIALYRRYLKESPAADDAARVRRTIEILEKVTAQP